MWSCVKICVFLIFHRNYSHLHAHSHTRQAILLLLLTAATDHRSSLWRHLLYVITQLSRRVEPSRPIAILRKSIMIYLFFLLAYRPNVDSSNVLTFPFRVVAERMDDDLLLPRRSWGWEPPYYTDGIFIFSPINPWIYLQIWSFFISCLSRV